MRRVLVVLGLLLGSLSLGHRPAGASSDPCDSTEILLDFGIDPDARYWGLAVSFDYDLYYGAGPETDRVVATIEPDRIVVIEWDQGQVAARSYIYGRFGSVWIKNPKSSTEVLASSGSTVGAVCTDSGDDDIDLQAITTPVHVDAGEGHDTVHGGSEGDTLRGGEGDDLLLGADGDDVIDGGPGADRLHGGPGDKDVCGSTGERLTRPPALVRDTIVACEEEL